MPHPKIIGITIITFTLIFEACKQKHSVLVNSTLIKNVNIINVENGSVLENMSVLVVDDKIEKISKFNQLKGIYEKVIDGNNGFLLPGLMDMHVHLGLPEYTSREIKKHFALLLAKGITTVRNMAGEPIHLQMKDSINRDLLLGPTIYTSSPMFERKYMVSDDSIRIGIRNYVEQGFDFIKLVRVPPEIYEVIAKEAENAGIKVVGHPPTFNTSFDHIIGSKMLSLEHITEVIWLAFNGEFDEVKAQIIARKIQESGTTISTLFVEIDLLLRIKDDYQSFLKSDEFKLAATYFDLTGLLANNIYEAYLKWDDLRKKQLITDKKIVFKFLKILVDNNVNLVAGTDARSSFIIPGYALHDELDLLVQAGLSPYQAIKAATLNPAKMLKKTDVVGSVTVCKIADLILVKSNPLLNIKILRNPEGVMVRGKWYDNENLESMLAEYKN